MMDNNYVTLVSSSEIANKIYHPNGTTTVGHLVNATAKTIKISNLKAMKNLIEHVGGSSKEVIILGYIPETLHLDEYELVTEANEDKPANKWGRLQRNFTQSSWFLLDRDATGNPIFDNLSQDEWFDEVEKLIPGIKEAGKVVTPSSSNRVEGGNSCGFHMFVQMEDIEYSEFKSVGKEILISAFAIGLGYKKADKIGQKVLPRTILDTSTFQSNRLVYEGKPYTYDKLEVSEKVVQIIDGAKVDLSRVVKSKPPEGFNRVQRIDGSTEYQCTDSLTMDMVIDTESYGALKLSEIDEKRYELEVNGKVRCQTPFRESSFSYAAYIGWHQNDEIFLFDSGSEFKFTIKVEPVYDSSVMSALDAFRSLAVTDKDIENIKSTVIIRADVLASGAVTVLVAPPESGKTVIARAISGELAKGGHEVFYIDMDSPQGVTAEMQVLSKTERWTYFNPEIVTGQSVEKIKAMLNALSESGEDLSGKVFVVDTLKKLADMIQKSSLKEVMTLFRKLSSLGASVLLLGHTNKFDGEDAEGKKKIAIPEGTQDLMNDSDCVLIVASHKDKARGIVYFSTITDKSKNQYVKNRFGFEPISGEMKIGKKLSDRTVTFHAPEDIIDVESKDHIANLLTKNAKILKVLKDVIRDNEGVGQEQIVKETHTILSSAKTSLLGQSPGIIKIRKALNDHSGEEGVEYVFLIIRDGNTKTYRNNPEYKEPFGG